MAGGLAPNHSKCFLHNVILEPWRRKHREASQSEAPDADSPAGAQATAKWVPVRVSGVGQQQGGREWPAWGRWTLEISTPRGGLEPNCLGSNAG